jgi:exonuclease VII large subunit
LNSILNTDNEICFYVDCIKSQSIAIQIATQIISCFDKKKLSQYTKSNGEPVTSVHKVKEGDQISLTISDGTILAMAKQIRTMDEKGK